MSIVVVGSLNMDLVVSVPRFPVAGETLLGGDYARHAGGKGANQAVAAARAGGDVAMLGRVGADAFGEALVDGLATDGVATEAVAALSDVPTGVAFISIDPSAQNTIIVAPGANARLAPDDLDAARFAGAHVVLLQLEVPLETTLRAAELGRGAGARVVLNLAPAQPLTAAQLARVDHVLGQAHGGQEAVVERAHGLAGRLGRGVAHAPGVVERDGHRLLADRVLAGLQGGDAGLGMDGVGPAVVDHVDPRVGDHLAPVGRELLVPVPGRLALDDLAVLVAEHEQPGRDARAGVDVGDRLVGVRVAFAHESTAQQADADLVASDGRSLLDGHVSTPSHSGKRS